MPQFPFVPSKAFLLRKDIDQATTAAITINGVAGKKIRVYAVVFNVTADQLITIQDSTPTKFMGKLSIGAKGGFVLDYNGHPWFECATATNLQVVLDNGVQTSGAIYYTLEDA